MSSILKREYNKEPDPRQEEEDKRRKENLQAFEEGLRSQRRPRSSVKVLRARQMAGDTTLTARELKRIEKWKMSPEGILASARAHLGHILNNTTGSGVRDLMEVVIYGALAYQSYNVLDGQDNGWPVALYGPLALKLATTPGDVSQATGVAMLAILGLVSIPGADAKLPHAIGPVPPGLATLYGNQPGFADDINKRIQQTFQTLQGLLGNL